MYDSIKTTDEIEKVMAYYEHLEYNMALITIKEFKLSSHYSEYRFMHKMILYSLEILMHYRLRKFDSYVKVFNEMEILYNNNQEEYDFFSNLTYYTHKIIHLCQTKEATKARDFVTKGDEIVSHIPDDFNDSNVARVVIFYYYALGWYYRSIHDYTPMTRIMSKSLAMAKKFKLCYYIVVYHRDFRRLQNNYDLIKIEEDAIEEKRYCDREIFNCLSLILAFSNFIHIGRLKESLEFMNKASELANNLPLTNEANIYLNYYSYLNTGIVYSLMGRYTDALESYKKSIIYAKMIFEKFRNPIPLSTIYNNMGNVYTKLGKLNDALIQLNNGYNAIKEDQTAVKHLSNSYFLLINLHINYGNKEQAEEYYDELHKLCLKTSSYNDWWSDFIQVQGKIGKAIILIEKKSMKAHSEAQEILESIINNKDISKDQIIDAILPLIRLQLQEYKIFQTEESFEKLKSLLENLQNLANNQNSIPLKIQSMIIKGKMNVIIGLFEEFESEFTNARNLAEEYSLFNLVNWIDSELSEFQAEYEKWKLLINTNSPLTDILDKVALEQYIKGVQGFLNRN